MSENNRPRVFWGFDPVTGARRYMVREPKKQGFQIDWKPKEGRAIATAYQIMRYLNEQKDQQCSCSSQ